MSIQDFSTEELSKDLNDSLKDVLVCQEALDAGITEYSGGSVLERLEANQRIIKTIRAELSARGM